MKRHKCNTLDEEIVSLSDSNETVPNHEIPLIGRVHARDHTSSK